MKQHMIKLAAALVFAAASIAACAGKASDRPAEEAFCDKLAECKALESGQTEQQCVDEQRKGLGEIRKKSECAPLVEKLEAFLSCVAEVSCRDLTGGIGELPKGHPCYDESEALPVVNIDVSTNGDNPPDMDADTWCMLLYLGADVPPESGETTGGG